MPARPQRNRRAALAIALLAGLTITSTTLATIGGGPDWGMIGNDSPNSRNQPFEHDIGAANVNRLARKWVATTAGDVSATPAVVNGAVYFGDFGGMLWKLDAVTGQVIWSHSVSDYTGIAGDIARTSPSVAGNTLVVGDLKHPDMLGIDAKTGKLRWITQVHPDPKGIMTGSPVLAGDTAGRSAPEPVLRHHPTACLVAEGPLHLRRCDGLDPPRAVDLPDFPAVHHIPRHVASC